MKAERAKSSKVTRALLPLAVLLAGCGDPAPADAASDPATRATYAARLADNAAGRYSAAPAGDALFDALVTWDRLRRDAYPASFGEIAAFLRARPGWPGELALRRKAEKALTAATPMPERLAFFTAFAPLSATAKFRFAEALRGVGRNPEAVTMARDAWDSAGLDEATEGEFLGSFNGVPTLADNASRFDRLMWSNQTTAAARLLPRLAPDRVGWAQARLAARSVGAAGPAGGPLASDAGLFFDRAKALQRQGNLAGARAVLVNADIAQGLVTDPEAWLKLRLELARSALRGGDASTAYRLAANHRALPLGRALADRPLAERAAFVDAEWFAGWVALKDLKRFADAQRHFENVRAAAQTPVSQSRGDYWTGRAAQAAGRRADADRFYTAAATHPDYFYGQLAAERLGRPLVRPVVARVVPSAEARRRFEADDLVRLTRLLGEIDAWETQTIFIRFLAERSQDPDIQRLTADLGTAIGRPDLGVLTGKAARGDGELALLDAAYPMLPLPAALGPDATIIHAIARQESQFDRRIVSSANARGLMQLLPGTAAEQAAKLGLDYSGARLFDDPVYNVTLGAGYFRRVQNGFDGSHVLALCGYNAGPGNARRFIAANGDPRAPGVDIVDWIEAIPIAETRTYVQRVLENAVMYDLLAGRGPASNRLSVYLGKSTPG